MKRLIFLFLKFISFCLRPLRHGYYMRILEIAYKIQGIRFNGKAEYIHHDAYIDNVGQITFGENIVISTKVIVLAHDYSPKIKQKLIKGGRNELCTFSSNR